jgi:hypothetical protein
MKEITFILIAGFGAVCIEAIHWYELRNKLEEQDTKNIMMSKYYWMITFIMIVISGIGTYILFYEPTIKNSIPFVLGAAFPLIFKKAVVAFQSRDLGDTSGTVTFEKAFKTFIQ